MTHRNIVTKQHDSSPCCISFCQTWLRPAQRRLQDRQREQEASGYVRIHDLSPITDGVLRDVDELRDQDVGDSLAAQEEDQQQEGFEGELATREHTSRSDAG